MSAAQKINLDRTLGQFSDLWSPKMVGQVNDCAVKLVKLRGDFVWHSHEAEDELFLVLHGNLRMQFRDHEVALGPGELIIVPRGIEHRPVADDETHVLLLEPASTINTGAVRSERTKQAEWLPGKP